MLKVSVIDSRITQLTFDDYRSSWLIRDKKTILIETGFPVDCQLLLAGLAKLNLTPKDIDYLALTHIHLDHAGGSGKIARLNPEMRVLVHTKGGRHLLDPTKLQESAKKAYGDRFAAIGEIEPVPEHNLRVIDSGDTIDLGTSKLKVYYTPGHAKHHVVFYDTASRGVFAGDALGSWLPDRIGFILTPPADYNKKQAKKSIDLIKALYPRKIYFTHCGPYEISEGDHFFENLKNDHEIWTRCVSAIIADNYAINREALFNAFLEKRPELNKHPDLFFSFRLSVNGILQYLMNCHQGNK